MGDASDILNSGIEVPGWDHNGEISQHPLVLVSRVRLRYKAVERRGYVPYPGDAVFNVLDFDDEVGSSYDLSVPRRFSGARCGGRSSCRGCSWRGRPSYVFL